MELDDSASILAKTEFFSICSNEQLRLMAFASERHRFSAGENLWESGDSSRGAYVLMNGRIAIKDDPEAQIPPYVVSEPNTVIATTALVLPKPRTSTATAISDVETLFVPREAFLKLARQYPVFAQHLANRVRGELTNYLGTVTALKDRIRIPSDQDQD